MQSSNKKLQTQELGAILLKKIELSLFFGSQSS